MVSMERRDFFLALRFSKTLYSKIEKVVKRENAKRQKYPLKNEKNISKKKKIKNDNLSFEI